MMNAIKKFELAKQNLIESVQKGFEEEVKKLLKDSDNVYTGDGQGIVYHFNDAGEFVDDFYLSPYANINSKEELVENTKEYKSLSKIINNVPQEALRKMFSGAKVIFSKTGIEIRSAD